jgi:hypothetical protein
MSVSNKGIQISSWHVVRMFTLRRYLLKREEISGDVRTAAWKRYFPFRPWKTSKIIMMSHTPRVCIKPLLKPER